MIDLLGHFDRINISFAFFKSLVIVLSESFAVELECTIFGQRIKNRALSALGCYSDLSGKFTPNMKNSPCFVCVWFGIC